MSSTATDKARFDAIQQTGCICTLLLHSYGQPCDIHHLTAGGRRLGHQYTIGLSPWNHRGVTADGLTERQMTIIYGPSLAHGRRPFEAFFGPQSLLLEIQNVVLEQHSVHNWHNFYPPHEVRRNALTLWTDGKNKRAS